MYAAFLTIFQCFLNIFSWKRSFKLNSFFIGFDLQQTSNMSASQHWFSLKVVNFCCRIPHLRCLSKSWIHFFTSLSEDLIKNIFHYQIFFCDQKSFPQAEIFPLTKKSSMIKEVFLKQIYVQRTFPQAKIFPWSGKVFCKTRFSLNQRNFKYFWKIF